MSEGRRESFPIPDVPDLFRRARDVLDQPTTRLMAVAVLIGVLGGASAGLLDLAIAKISQLWFGTTDPSAEVAAPWWVLLIAPIIGGVAAGALIRFGTRPGRAYAVPDVIHAASGGPSLSFRNALASAGAAAVAVGSGLSGGREGPTVQLAGAVADHLCRRFDLPRSRTRVLIAAGAAAGIAASFNAPIGAAIFSMEILLGSFAMQMFAPVVAATVTGTIVGQAILGERVALKLPAFSLHSPVELVLYLGLGLVGAVVAIAFKGTILAVEDRVEAAGVPRWARPALAGVAVGVLAMLGGHAVMGNGYGYDKLLLAPDLAIPLNLVALVLVLKFLASAVSAAGRAGPGTFAPILMIGAGTGTLYGALAQVLWPSIAPSPGAYGMVGMGAVFAAFAHAPLTIVIMLFEMTGDYEIILPLLLSLSVAGLVAHAFDSQSFYRTMLARRGVVTHHAEGLVMYDLVVRDLVRGNAETIAPDASFRRLVALFLHPRVHDVVVVDPDGRYHGLVELQEVKGLLGRPHDELLVADVERRDVPVLRPEQPIAESLEAFFRADLDELPVVAPDGRFVGVLRERDVLAAYDREVLRHAGLFVRIEGEDDEGGRSRDFFELPPGTELRSIAVPGEMAGRPLREARLPSRFHCNVLAVIRDDPDRPVRVAPEAGFVLAASDRLVVLGPTRDLDRLVGEGMGGAP